MSDPVIPSDLLDNILSRNLEWVRAADSKAAPFLAIDTAMLGVLVTFSAKMSSWNTPAIVACALTTFLLLISIGYLIAVSFPRLSGPQNSLIFFGEISKLSLDDYQKNLKKLTQTELDKDFAQQCHRNAEIANTKFKYARNAMLSLYLSVIPWLVSLAYLLAPQPINPVINSL